MLLTKFFNSRITPCSICSELSVIFSWVRYHFVSSQFHFKVQLFLVGHTQIFSFWNKMLKLSTITCIIKVYTPRSEIRLSRFSTFQNFRKQWISLFFRLQTFTSVAESTVIINFIIIQNICVLSQTINNLGFCHHFLNEFSFFYVFLKFVFPFFDIIIIKRRWIWNGFHGTIVLFFLSFVFVSTFCLILIR